MRRILVDHARSRQAAKRGGSAIRLPLEEAIVGLPGQDLDFIALDEALTRLAEIDLQQGQIVELRFFSGLSVEETAKVLDVSERTVKRDWNVAKACLRRELSRGGQAGAPSVTRVTPEQWHRVKQVFEAALGHAPEARSAFLGQACGGDDLLWSNQHLTL